MMKNLSNIIFKPLVVALVLISMVSSCTPPRHGGHLPAPPGMKH